MNDDLSVSLKCSCCDEPPSVLKWSNFLEFFPNHATDGMSVAFVANFRGSRSSRKAAAIDRHIMRVLRAYGVGQLDQQELVGVFSGKNSRDI